jgi:hypothetical protein
MKNTKNLVSTALLAAALFALSFISVYTVAQSQDVPTKDELTTLLKNASTPLEHHRIAMYYKLEASRLKQDAESHRAYANIYAKGQGLAHCTNLAKFDEQAAKEAAALATMHENMAKAAEQKQQ